MNLPDEFPASFESQGYFIFDQFLDDKTIAGIRNEMLRLSNDSLFKKAGIGKREDFRIDEEQRGDFILWIDPLNALSQTALFIDKINALIVHLNRNFYLGIKEYECHYAIYPSGTFYKRHVDKHHKGSPRVVSFVFYLNENWSENHGGQLRIYGENDCAFDVEPEAGRLVVFLSEKEHEVMLTHYQRMSITGWMLIQ